MKLSEIKRQADTARRLMHEKRGSMDSTHSVHSEAGSPKPLNASSPASHGPHKRNFKSFRILKIETDEDSVLPGLPARSFEQTKLIRLQTASQTRKYWIVAWVGLFIIILVLVFSQNFTAKLYEMLLVDNGIVPPEVLYRFVEY